MKDGGMGGGGGVVVLGDAQSVGQPWARRNLARQIKGDQLRPDDRQANDAAAREIRGKKEERTQDDDGRKGRRRTDLGREEDEEER